MEGIESDETTIDDILSLLPLDPHSKNLEKRFELGIDRHETEQKVEEGGVFGGLIWGSWNSAVLFPPKEATYCSLMDCSLKSCQLGFNVDSEKNEEVELTIDDILDVLPLHHLEESFELDNGLSKLFAGLYYWNRAELCRFRSGEPHEAFEFVLPYLGLAELLSVEMVCKSLRYDVANNPLLWRNIAVFDSLSMKINDNALLNMVRKAKGMLECLTLIRCNQITNAGLKRVLYSNPKLKKLCVPGCRRISVDNILHNLRAMKSAGKLGIKLLRISGFEENRKDALLQALKLVLTPKDNTQKKQILHRPVKPFYCYNGQTDFVPCQRCDEAALVCIARGPLARGDTAAWDAACADCGCLCVFSHWNVLGKDSWYDIFAEDCYQEPTLKQPVERIVSSLYTLTIFDKP